MLGSSGGRPVNADAQQDFDAQPDGGADRPPVTPGRGYEPAAAARAFGDLSGSMMGHYLLESQIGGGAMATVYRAVDRVRNRPVALKVLAPGADDITRRRFQQEARTVSVLEHPNIVRTLQVGQTSGGVTYIAMELVDGPSLSDLLARLGTLPVHDTCALLEPIARALGFAHAAGIVHRDVKPANILLRRVAVDAPGAVLLSGTGDAVVPLLSDFGIARALDAPELTAVGRTIGTPAFMAPEQCAGDDEIDGRADIYSLGAVCYRCLVGRAPYTGTTTQILYAHVYEPLLMPDDVLARLPASAVDILRRALMKEPAQRYFTAAAMAADLALVLGKEAPLASGADAVGHDAATLTMASLPVAQAVTTSQVLVPAPPRGRPIAPLAGPPVATRVPALPQEAPTHRRPNRLSVAALSAALLVLLAIFALTLVNNIDRSPGAPTTIAQAQVPAGEQPASSETPVPTREPEGAALAAATRPSTPSMLSATPVASPASTAPAGTPTSQPTPSVSLKSAWADAQAFYAERDWREAVDWLTLIRRIDDGFETQRIGEMLFESFVGVATDNTLKGDFENAREYLDLALELQPSAPYVVDLQAATDGLIKATPSEQSQAREALQRSHVRLAQSLAAADQPCAALPHLQVALSLQASPDVATLLDQFNAACERRQRSDAVAGLKGHFLYSAEQDGQNRIFLMPAARGALSTLVIDNSAQPQLNPAGDRVALFSTRPDMQGLAGFDLGRTADINERSIRYTEFVEDGRDSPPSWNPQGDRLVYASTNYGDGRSRVYLTWADGSRNTQVLTLGKDPAWHPSQDWIVFNGTDNTGNQPGLWLIRPDGTDAMRLTDNGNDIRPTWSPDGRYVVFMSSGRDGNWELYRVDVVDQRIERLTDNPAQDGLPTVSLDGQYVAFLSDRGGAWRVWVTPMDGGDVELLADIAGNMPRWLEHAIQWVD